MYTKDLASLLSLLSVSGQSGILLIEPAESGKNEWQAQLSLQEGVVTTCSLINKADGRNLLGGKAVIDLLTQSGALLWILEESPGPSGLPSRPGALPQEQKNVPTPSPPLGVIGQPGGMHAQPRREGASNIPRRTALGAVTPIDGAWPREYRVVFAMIDGRHSSEELASLLHRSLDEVNYVLQQLRVMGLID
ncbi:MAG: hypothetical protein ACJ788_17820 [Ktedonobacteraceae bacterium]